MNLAPLRRFSFWATFLLTNLSLLLVSGVVLDGVVATVAGWVGAILTALGYRSLVPGQRAELPQGDE